MLAHEILARVNTSAWGQFGSVIREVRKNRDHHAAVWSFLEEGPPLFGWRTTHLILHEQLTVVSLCRMGEIRQGMDGCSSASR